VIKIKYFPNFQNEERWLEHMAAQGYKLTRHNSLLTLVYRFVSASPEQVSIKIDYRTFKSQIDFQDYCSLFEDSGWFHVAGTKDSGNQYFRRVNANSNEDIFSNATSRAERYKRLSNNALGLCFFFVPLIYVGFMLLNLEGFLNPQGLWFTPGLWDSEINLRWWFAFLFEMPFALMRGYAAPIMILISSVSTLFYLYVSIISRKVYKEMLNRSEF